MSIATQDQSRAQVAQRSSSFLIPNSYDAIEVLAAKLCAAKWVPKSYMDRNGEPNQPMVEVAIMHGIEVGLPPLAAVQNIAVINGMPSVWGDAMIGLVRNSGLMEDIQERFEGAGDEMAAICTVKRRGQASPVEVRFSVAMAKKANLWTKQGPWSQYPSRMLKLRARSWCLRDAFADVLKGLSMAEEAMDMIDVTPSDPAPARPKKADFKAGAANKTVTDVAPSPEDELAADRAAADFAENGSVDHDPETGEIDDGEQPDEAQTDTPQRNAMWASDSYAIALPPESKNQLPLWAQWFMQAAGAALADDELMKLDVDNAATMNIVKAKRTDLYAEIRAAIKAQHTVLAGSAGI